MAISGQVLDNPISGERITFRKTAADTGGEILAFDLELSPTATCPALTSTQRRRSVSRSLRGP